MAHPSTQPRIRRELHTDRLVRCYADRPTSVVDMLARSFARLPDRTAVVDGDTRLSYAGLLGRSLALAQHLRGLGVAQGDRVAVMLPNGQDAVTSVVAIAYLGAALVPLGTRLREPEIAYIFSDARPVAVIFDATLAADMPATRDGAGPTHRLQTGTPDWDRAIATAVSTDFAPAAVAEEDLFGVLYTSGTTGKPKGAMLTHFNVVHSCLHWEDAHALTHDECTLVCVPWSHVAGLCGVVLPFLHLSATLVTMAEFRRREFLELAQRERITHALMVPAMYGLCLLEPDLADFDLSAWRIAAYGSAPMPEPTIERFATTFPLLQMCNCYGATETTSPATMMPPGEGVAHADSIGRVVPCGDIVVVDEDGRELPPGEVGELWIGGPMVVPGYWENAQANQASFADGYWRSGDIGSIDAHGYVRIADRKKDMINRGGFKIYPAEVESLLTALKGVVEVAVVGRPDIMLGESVVAFVNCATQGLTEESVRTWCASRMADYKVPTRVVIESHPMPRNTNGKIQKADLRERALQLE